MLWLTLLLATLIGQTDIPKTQHTTTTKGIATIFGYAGDKYGSGPTRCLRDEAGKRRPVDPENDVGIAHRYLDCGAVVYVTNLETGKTIRAVVVDAGPWGAVSRNPDTGKWVWYIKRHRHAKPPKGKCPSQRCPVGRYRGIVDLTPKAAELLDHDGWAKVKLVYDRRDLRWHKTRRGRRSNQI